MGLKKGIVKIEEYNAKWKEDFEKEKEELKSKFEEVAQTIEHIGSTSVEGLSAKPIIDIAVGINSFEDFKKVKSKFLNEPYSVKEDSDPGEILIRKGPEENRTHFIHVMEISSERYQNAIIFRDFLRNNKDTRVEYENLKKELATQYASDRKSYTKAKNNFIQDVLKMAKKG